MKLHLSIPTIIALNFLAFACADRSEVFHLLDSGQSGIGFSNDIAVNDTFNPIYYEYIYNGGGVAAGDLNGDGLADLFFTGNQVSSKLYINKGELRFEDVTRQTGLETDRWCTGVAVADINGDGKKDIYISVAGYNVPEERMENLLFINQGWDEDGIPSFTESAAEYGLNDAGYSTQAAFFDYDLDGDLDMYLLTNALEKFNRNNLRPRRVNGEAAGADRLYRNNGDETFTDVSREAGILIEGYGLGVAVADLNFDGYPDVYAANDFLSNDLVWINNGDGTFTNKAGEYLKHQTHNGMGVDIADVNNDALPDIAVLDMLPEDNYRQKMMIPYVNYDKLQMKRDLGYEDQYMRNTLQLHQGFAADGSPRFSEIGNLSGMAATDWSWAVLFADFDNNGWKDVFITNGYRKDVTNLDYVSYSAYNQIFGTAEAKRKKAAIELEEMQDVKISNYLFSNTGSLQLENVAESWGLDVPSFSNGAAYADLDNDGDLDLVVNNIDAPAFLFENRSAGKNPGARYIQIKLEEDRPDMTAYNSKVLVYANGKIQYQEFSPFRGYKSTVDELLHFGLGDAQTVDSIVVYWPDGSKTNSQDIAPNQRIILRHAGERKGAARFKPGREPMHLFQAAGEKTGLRFQHADNNYTELKTIRTITHDHSKTGPAVAVGDINGDGLEDLFAGGNAGQAGAFFVQNTDGTFFQYAMPHDSSRQDADALLFDADGDGDNDLYVVSGGVFAPAGDALYQDRLYLNDGKGGFSPAPDALPEIRSSGSCVRAADYDGDGDTDLFVGGRILPGRYPLPPRSYLLRNEEGWFVDATPEELIEPGLVTDALWTDFNDDRREDLVLVGEWMPVTFFENRGGDLKRVEMNLNGKTARTNGWWMHINSADLDGDGDVDYLLGNLGLNSKLKAAEEEPVKLYAKDFDNNGAVDPLLSCYIQGKEHLMHERDLLINQIPGMKRRFPNYASYAKAGLDETLTSEDLQGAAVYACYLFSSVILENEGDGRFEIHELPLESQLSPITGSIFMDFDQDGALDIFAAGNFHATETTQIGLYDASYGVFLLQKGAMQFCPVPALQFSLQADGDVRTVRSLKLANGRVLLLFGVYGGSLKSYATTRLRQ